MENENTIKSNVRVLKGVNLKVVFHGELKGIERSEL